MKKSVNINFKDMGKSPDIYYINIDKNENPFPVPYKLIEHLREKISSLSLNRYPDAAYERIKKTISGIFNFPPENIVIGNGGDEILWLLFAGFVRPGDSVLTLNPAFSEYAHLCSVYGVNHCGIPLLKNGSCFTVDETAFLKKLESNTFSLVLIDNPNNPTGIPMNRSFLDLVISKSTCPVVIDEAYGDFAQSQFVTGLEKEKIPDNTVILKTLSKAWGLAGIRLGFALCSRVLAERLEKIKSPFNVNVLTEEIAYTLLNNPDWIKGRVERIIETRDTFTAKVNDLYGWKAYPGEGNFVLLESKSDMEIIKKRFDDANIRVKYMELEPFPGNWVRISIGTEPEMERFFEVISEI